MGRELRALVLLAPVCGSGVRPSRARAAGALWGAPCEDAREARLVGGGEEWSCPGPRWGGGGRGAPDVRIAPSISARELLGNRPTLLSALPRPLAGEEGVARINSHCSEQRGRDIGEA